MYFQKKAFGAPTNTIIVLHSVIRSFPNKDHADSMSKKTSVFIKKLCIYRLALRVVNLTIFDNK